MHPTNFTPALGWPQLTGAYDLAIRLLTRERHGAQPCSTSSLPPGTM